jgi:outer membrane lipase/esterase
MTYSRELQPTGSASRLQHLAALCYQELELYMRNPILAGMLMASATLANPGFASPYSDIYVFGDSLFDNGQFYGIRATNWAGPDYRTPPSGPVSPTFVAAGLGLSEAAPSRDGGTDYAVSGNNSTDILQSIVAAATYQSPFALDHPPLDPNFNSLFYNLRLSGQALPRKALYLLDGGGNDIGSGLAFNEDTAASVAANMVDAANALRERGAKYVVIANVLDVGLTPASAPLRVTATALSAAINGQIQQQVGTANILILNTFGISREVAAAPEAYGILLTATEFSRACFSTSAGSCSGGNSDAKLDGSNPDPSQFFFNDELHPTTIGQQVFGDYILSVLTAPAEIALLPQMGIDDMQSQWRSTRPVMQSNRWQAATRVGSYSVWGGANYNEDKHETDYDNTGTNESTQYNVGVSFRPAESWYVGGQVGRADNEMKFGASASRYQMDSLNFTLLGGFHHGPWFAEAVASYSDLSYDELKRRFTLGPVLTRTESADTSGEALGIRLAGGLNIAASDASYRFGPTWSYEYIDAEVDGYQEKSGDATALRVNDMKTTSGIGSAGLFGDLQLGFCDCNVYSELTYRAYLDNGATNPRIGLVSLPGNSAKLPGYEQDDDSVRWDVGMAASLGRATRVNVGGGITDADNGDAFWYGAELIYSF